MFRVYQISVNLVRAYLSIIKIKFSHFSTVTIDTCFASPVFQTGYSVVLRTACEFSHLSVNWYLINCFCLEYFITQEIIVEEEISLHKIELIN